MRTSNHPSVNKTVETFNGTYLKVYTHENLLNIQWRFSSFSAPNSGTGNNIITITNIVDNTTCEIRLPTTFSIGAGNNVIREFILPLNYGSISCTDAIPPGS